MRIAIGADHAGHSLKEEVAYFLREQGHQVVDMGTHGTGSCDYPDYARAVAQAVAAGEVERGILICGTGIGMSIAANKIAGVRAALCYNTFAARLSRTDNDANVLCLGGRVLGVDLALDIVRTWLETDFAGGRHQRRVDKIAALER